VQTPLLQIGKGLPSAKLDAEVNNRTTPTARTRRIFFMVMLLDEMERPCYSARQGLSPLGRRYLFFFSESVNL
jgi:hypothetical protein